MVEDFFTQVDVGLESPVSVYNFAAFARLPERWFKTLDELGRDYTGSKLEALLRCVQQHQGDDLLVLLAADDSVDSYEQPVTAWLVAKYTDNLTVEFVSASAAATPLVADAFDRLKKITPVGDGAPSIGVPEALDFRG